MFNAMFNADVSKIPANIATTVVTPHNFNRETVRKMNQVQTSKNSNNIGDKSQKNPPYHSKVTISASRSSPQDTFESAFSTIDFFA